MALFQQGGLTVGRIAGVPVRFQLSALLGAFVFTGFRFDLVRWLAFFGLIIAHEVGHALVVKAAGGKATLIELTGYGGLCHWRGDVTPTGRAAIAWGGVWAQLVLLGLALGYAFLYGEPDGAAAWRIFYTLTTSNIWMIALNLVPIPPLDGAEAWSLPILLGRSLRSGPASPPLPAVHAHSAHDEAFESGARGDEVKAIVSDLLEGARKE